MDDLALFVKDDEHGKSETRWIAQTLVDLARTLVLVAGVVHMDIDKIVVDGLADFCIVCDKLCEPPAPFAPVSAYLTNHILAFGGSLGHSLVNLCHRVDALVVVFHTLCRHGNSKQQRQNHEGKITFHIHIIECVPQNKDEAERIPSFLTDCGLRAVKRAPLILSVSISDR